MEPINENLIEKAVLTLIEKIKGSKTLSIRPELAIHDNRQKYPVYLFKFDTFDIKVSFEKDKTFLEDVTYNRLEFNQEIANLYFRQEKSYSITDMVVKDKQGQQIFDAACVQLKRQPQHPLINADLGQKVYAALFNRAVQEKIRRDRETAEKKRKKQEAMLNAGQNAVNTATLKKEQDAKNVAMMVEALHKIEKL